MTTLSKLYKDLGILLRDQPELGDVVVYTAEDEEGNNFRKIVDTELLQAFVQLNSFGNLPYMFDEFEDAYFQEEDPEDGWERVLILN